MLRYSICQLVWIGITRGVGGFNTWKKRTKKGLLQQSLVKSPLFRKENKMKEDLKILSLILAIASAIVSYLVNKS